MNSINCVYLVSDGLWSAMLYPLRWCMHTWHAKLLHWIAPPRDTS